jgi:hypothetical protein
VLPVLVFFKDVLALRFADALDDHLLGGLRGDTTERATGRLEVEELAVALVLLASALDVGIAIEDLEEQLVADLRLDPGALGLLEADLAARVLHPLDHVEHVKQVHVPGLGVKGRLDVAVLEDLLRGGRDRLLHGLDQRLA